MYAKNLLDRVIEVPAKQNEDWRKVLRAAADRLERYGWVQGRPCRGTAFCASFAINNCTNWDNARSIGPTERLLRHVGFPTVQEWNDSPGMTAEKVIATMREVAAS